MIALSQSARDWLADATGIAVDSLQISPWCGANSSAVYAIDNAHKPRAARFVLPVFDDKDWLVREPDLLIHETFALVEARHCQVKTPRLMASSAGEVGFGAPVVLMSRLRGQVELRPADLRDWSAKLAHALTRIHAHKATGFGWEYRSWIEAARPQVPQWTAQPQLWQRAIKLWHVGPPRENEVFLHRDFHPVNVLWHHGKVSGVVDWVNACIGPRGVDVAHCRTNLAVLFGVEIADHFRDCYLSYAGGRHHPFWDVASILDMSLPEPEFYRPWSEFGLDVLSTPEMARRDEIYLQSVMEQVRD